MKFIEETLRSCHGNQYSLCNIAVNQCNEDIVHGNEDINNVLSLYTATNYIICEYIIIIIIQC